MPPQQAIAIRPMTGDDVIAVDAASYAAFRELWPAEQRPGPEIDRSLEARGRGRIAHLLATDPGGAWVAEDTGGAVVGAALALIREGLWGLSMLAVAPGLQGRGIGVRLLEAAYAYGSRCSSQLILSSADPRAMRAYHRLGLEVRPSLEASGPLNRSRIPAGLTARPGDVDVDAATIDAASRFVRGASHRRDLPAALNGGGELLVVEGRGFAVARDGSPYLVAATDEETAADLTWSCLATAAPGETVNVMFITQGNDWALRLALDAGLTVTPDGPIFTRGVHGAMAPFLASGAYL